MAYSRIRIGGFLVVAALLAVGAVQAFGVPLGALLIIGLFLCFPLLLLGARGSAHKMPESVSPEVKPSSRPGGVR